MGYFFSGPGQRYANSPPHLFPLTVENTTLAAGENEARDPAHLIIGSPNQQDKAAVSDHVESTDSRRADAQVTVSVYNEPKFHPIFWRVPRIKRQKSSYACAWRSRGFYVLTQTVAPGPQPVTVSTSQPTSPYG